MSAPVSAGPARVATLNCHRQGGSSLGGELVVVAAGQRLQRHQRRVVLEQHADVARRFDLCLAGAADDAFPAQPRTVEPVGQLDPAERAAPVVELGEGGGAPARRGDVRARRRRRSFRAGSGGSRPGPGGRPAGAGQGGGGRRQGAGEAGQRPAVGGDQRVVAAGVGEPRRAGDPPRDRAAEGVVRVDLAARRRGRRSPPGAAARSAPSGPPARRSPFPSRFA